MKFGTYFAYWQQEWESDYVSYCAKVASLGFDVLEIGAHGIVSLAPAQIASLRSEAQNSNITLTSCIGLPAEYDVASLDEQTRRRGVERFKQTIAKIEEAGIRSLGGVIYGYWPCDYNKPFDKAAARAKSIESMYEMADFAADHGVTLMLEVVNRFEHFMLNTAEEAVAYVKEVGRENVKVMLDCFHMNIEEDFLGDALRNTGNLLGHFHIGECNRKVPGKGHMPWDDIAQGLKDIHYDGAVVMEPFVRPGGTVGKAIKVWRDLSGNADEKMLDRDIEEALRFVKSKFL